METVKTQKETNLGQIPKFVHVLFERPLEWMDGNKHTHGNPLECCCKVARLQGLKLGRGKLTLANSAVTS